MGEKRSDHAAAAAGRFTAEPWYMLTVITAVNAVNWADRQVVSILFPLIKADLQLTDTQLGLIGGLAFSLIYALSSFVFGRAADYRVRRSIIAFGRAQVPLLHRHLVDAGLLVGTDALRAAVAASR